MNEGQLAVIAYRLERAREAFDDAALLLEAGRANAAVNRLYYGCFYAASAALLANGFASPKHSGIRALLHRHLVKYGVVPVHLGKFFDLLFNSRQKGDYSDFVRFEAESVRPWLDQAREFIDLLAAEAYKEEG